MAGTPFERFPEKQGFHTTSKLTISRKPRGRYGVFTPVGIFVGPEGCYWGGVLLRRGTTNCTKQTRRTRSRVEGGGGFRRRPWCYGGQDGAQGMWRPAVVVRNGSSYRGLLSLTKSFDRSAARAAIWELRGSTHPLIPSEEEDMLVYRQSIILLDTVWWDGYSRRVNYGLNPPSPGLRRDKMARLGPPLYVFTKRTHRRGVFGGSEGSFSLKSGFVCRRRQRVCRESTACGVSQTWLVGLGLGKRSHWAVATVTSLPRLTPNMDSGQARAGKRKGKE